MLLNPIQKYTNNIISFPIVNNYKSRNNHTYKVLWKDIANILKEKRFEKYI